MGRKLLNVWRGLLSVTLSLALALLSLTGVANTWRTTIDQGLGTTSTITTDDDKFVSDYSTTDELIQAHVELGEDVGEEGTVLLKNENNALPLANDGAKVTLLGMGSMYPFMGGTMGSTIEGASQKDLVTALEEKGFTVNPTMTAIYEKIGSYVTGEAEGWGGKTPIYGYRPANFATPYAPSEPALDFYIAADGGGADANYADSFAEYGDAAIVVISRPGSEGSDYYPGEEGIDSTLYGTDSALSLAANEKALLALAEEKFETVIVLINSGSTMEIEELKNDEKVDSILYIGFPGAYGFLGVANVLNGTTSPSGHLSDTYPVENASAPAAQNFGRIALKDLSAIVAEGSLMGTLAATSPLGSFGGEASLSADYYLVEAEGIYTGYKYYETRYNDILLGNGNASSKVGASNDASEWNYEDEVSYSFGYGMSYTTFEQTLGKVSVDTDQQTVTAEVTVKNTGAVAGKDVAQLYVQVPYTEYDQENLVEKSAIQFLGMEKTDTLEPGAEQTVTITVDMEYMASWDSKAKDGKGGYILDGGDYYFALGNGAHDAVNNVLTAQNYTDAGGNASAVSVQVIGTKGEVDETTFAYSNNGTEVVNQLQSADINYYLPEYATYLSRSDWEGTFPRTYDDLEIGGEKEAEWVKNLTNEVYQVTTDSVVDATGSGGTLTLADLAGDTNIEDAKWGQLVDQIPADQLFTKIIKGGSQSDIISEIDSPLVYQNDGPNGFSGNLSARGLNTEDPNAEFTMGTMANEVILACTYNKELISEWGRLMGNDGLMSGNFLIWGTAANIHRCAFNGRNFEYYSEDPVLSNYMTTETVKGALEYGVLVGPKHFAFNDQESQRSGIAPYMTEQKAREGDLRAFQGAFEEAGALAAMTSFSRIGATPVNGSWGLLKNILREEWGFKGILSTDMVNNTGYFRPEMCIYAGVTMMADFSTDETFAQVSESWPYITEELIAGDEQLVSYAQENMKYQLYAFAQSAAQNRATLQVTPWWESALYGGIYGGFALSVVFLGFYIMCLVKNKKEEV